MNNQIHPPVQPTKRPATEFESENLSLGLKVQDLLAPNGYHDKKPVGLVATRPPWLLKETVMELCTVAINGRKIYRTSLVVSISKLKKDNDERIQTTLSSLDEELNRFILFRDRKKIKFLRELIIEFRGVNTGLERILQLLNK